MQIVLNQACRPTVSPWPQRHRSGRLAKACEKLFVLLRTKLLHMHETLDWQGHSSSMLSRYFATCDTTCHKSLYFWLIQQITDSVPAVVCPIVLLCDLQNQGAREAYLQLDGN